MTDYVYDAFSYLDPARARSGGYGAAMRYLAPVNNATRPKILTPGQAYATHAAGLALGLNWEWYEDRPLGGFSAGASDAMEANRQASALGAPRLAAIYYSVDRGFTWSQVADYFRGIHSVGGRPAGIYGGTTVGHPCLDEGLAVYFWQANAASWSGFSSWDAMFANRSPRASLIQHVHNRTPLHIPGYADTAFDPNTVLKPAWGQWLPDGSAANGTNLTEDDMGYASWNDLEKLAFARDQRNMLVSLLRGQPFLPGQPNEAPDLDLSFMLRVNRGDPQGDKVANFATDVHSGLGQLLTLVRKMAAAGSSTGSADSGALEALRAEIAALPANVRAEFARSLTEPSTGA